MTTNSTETIIKYLKLYNKWRRGDEKMKQPNPTEIGKLIDEACEKLVSLERERDEAREKYAILATENMLDVNKLAQERDEWAAMCGRYKQERDEAITRRMETIMQCELYEEERDEAREELENHTALTIHTCHANCKRPMCVLRRERDEARDDLAEETKFHHRTHAELVQVQCQLQDVIRERDEALAELAEYRSIAENIGAKKAVSEKEKAIQERDEAREIAAVYREYAQLLSDEINDMAGFASVHGWQSSRIEQGKLLRDKIKQLEGAK